MIFFSKLISYHNYFWQARNVWRISLAVSTVNSKYQSKSRSVLSQHVNTKFWNCWFFSAVDYYYCYDYYRSTYNEWIGSFKSILTQSFWDLSRHSWSWFIVLVSTVSKKIICVETPLESLETYFYTLIPTFLTVNSFSACQLSIPKSILSRNLGINQLHGFFFDWDHQA